MDLSQYLGQTTVSTKQLDQEEIIVGPNMVDRAIYQQNAEHFSLDSLSDRAAADCSLVPSVGDR